MNESAPRPTRRELLRAAPFAALSTAAAQKNSGARSRPNVVLVISDQFRWDLIGAMGLNPMNLTPNLDAMARRGVLFRNAYCNQPVCAPARGSIFTGQYPWNHGVWKNGMGLAETAPTLAGALRNSGYTANYIGKWHLAGAGAGKKEMLGPVPPERRGGFLDLWQASNVLELTSHAYEGDLYDNDGKPIHFSGTYRSDFITQLAEKFLASAKAPFFLTLSYLEVHHQNDIDKFVPPKEYAGRYPNPFVPPDLGPLPGSWPSQLSDYFACVAKMDETVGTIRRILASKGLDRNTILIFTSDHGCHFKTRNTEYKRSPHESSIHVPLIVEGPGFDRGAEIGELVGQVDYAPTLLAAAGAAVPSRMEGHSFLPLLDRQTENWRNEVYFQMAEFVTGRGLRTPQYTYAAMAPKTASWRQVRGAEEYVEWIAYDNFADPYQHVNLAGRAPYKAQLDHLRERLVSRMKETGERAEVTGCWFPYS
ncbi:MAG: sulfatase-like hydrolase/transferase [Bryobacteraceae bacterium]|jgi:arylsulfatase A-like enzyme